MANPPYDQRSFSGAALPTTLASGGVNFTDASGVIPLTATAASLKWYEVNASGAATGNLLGYSGNFVIALDYGLSTEEKILCSGISGSSVTIWTSGGLTGRGWDGTTAQTHTSTTGIVVPVYSAADALGAAQLTHQILGNATAANELVVSTGANAVGIVAAPSTAGQSLTYNGTTVGWANGTANVTISPAAVPPSSPIQGNLWYTSDTHTLFVNEVSGGWTSTTPGPNPIARITASTGTSLSAATPTTIAFDTTTFAQNGLSRVSNGIQVTIPGYYQIHGGYTLVSSSGFITAQIAVDGTAKSQAQISANSGGASVAISDILYVAANKIITLVGDQTSGGTVTTYATAPAQAFLSATLVSQ